MGERDESIHARGVSKNESLSLREGEGRVRVALYRPTVREPLLHEY